MKKILVLILALAVLLSCACNKKASETTDDDSSDTDNSSIEIEFDYPDQLKYIDGGTASMTIYKCGACYYACVDGTQVWTDLCGEPPVVIEDAEFIHVEADYNLAYGGIAGYWGTMHITKVRDERVLSLNEVVDCRMLALYDPSEGGFTGARLIVKDGKNYMICRDPLRKYRIYDEDANPLCTYDTAMAAAAYLDEGNNQAVEYSSPTNIPYLVIRIGDIYYAYSRYSGTSTWTPLLNMQFENKPVGFELEDSQAMKIKSSRVYIVNGGDEGYVNAPMFENAKDFSRITYADVNADGANNRWEITDSYEDGKLYSYYANSVEYLIFYFDGCFYLYSETGSDLNTEVFAGKYNSPEEVDSVLGRY